MTEIPMRQRCIANNRRGVRCEMWTESGEGEKFCRYHVGGVVTAAVHERYRQATRKYWAHFHLAKRPPAGRILAEIVRLRATWAYFNDHGNIKMAGQPLMNQPRCGAKTRAGHPCRRSCFPGKRRCINHGGAPGSGMRTPEGIRRSAEGVRRYFAARRAAKAASAAAVSL